VRTDPVEDDRFAEELDRTRERARGLAGEMRRGAIGRRPLGGRCPAYCTYQPICRLERAVGAVGGNGDAGEEGE
jgi:hypothetical protein